ncbi:UNVERIFIED_CONTAM: hypothetical protein GTU68_003843 [Idotea baltica]|nr:hypothetical protein [Idotea baltica]
MYSILALASLTVLVCLALFPLARRSGTPMLLVVLAVGMLLGEDGPGGFQFDNFQLAFDLGSVALAAILFAGGIETDKGVLRSSGVPSLVLAFPGVLITAGIVGAAAYFLLDMPLMLALLLGAVVAPTDAAATFMLIQQGGLKLPDRLKNTLLLESGFNDPASICLTVVLTTLIGTTVQAAAAEWAPYVWLILAQITFGFVGGILGGKLLAELLNRLPMPIGTYPILAMAGGGRIARLFVDNACGWLWLSCHLHCRNRAAQLADRAARTDRKLYRRHAVAQSNPALFGSRPPRHAQRAAPNNLASSDLRRRIDLHRPARRRFSQCGDAWL